MSLAVSLSANQLRNSFAASGSLEPFPKCKTWFTSTRSLAASGSSEIVNFIIVQKYFIITEN